MREGGPGISATVKDIECSLRDEIEEEADKDAEEAEKARDAEEEKRTKEAKKAEKVREAEHYKEATVIKNRPDQLLKQ